jgi:hypothetical protein
MIIRRILSRLFALIWYSEYFHIPYFCKLYASIKLPHNLQILKVFKPVHWNEKTFLQSAVRMYPSHSDNNNNDITYIKYKNDVEVWYRNYFMATTTYELYKISICMTNKLTKLTPVSFFYLWVSYCRYAWHAGKYWNNTICTFICAHCRFLLVLI